MGGVGDDEGFFAGGPDDAEVAGVADGGAVGVVAGDGGQEGGDQRVERGGEFAVGVFVEVDREKGLGGGDQ